MSDVISPSPIRHRAGWVMCGPGQWIENGIVTVSRGRVVGVERAASTLVARDVTDHGPGVILPALVNAHTHVTLSALAGTIGYGGGFLAWIRRLMSARRTLKEGTALEASQSAIADMRSRGVGLVGEFGPYFPVAETLAASGLAGTVWLEFFGNRKELPELPGPSGEVISAYAGHAPNTASPALLSRIKAADREKGLPFCLHLAESEEEAVFLKTGRGPWADFLEGLGMSFSHWDCWGRSPVRLAADLGLLDDATLAVHLLQVTADDMALLARSGVKVCLCPRSNLNLHGRLPDIEGFLGLGMAPALGTDSLASCDTLNIFDEMRFVADRFPGLRPEAILAMGTANGARALGRNDLGLIAPGAAARLIYVDMEADGAGQAAERLVHVPPDRVDWLGA